MSYLLIMLDLPCVWSKLDKLWMSQIYCLCGWHVGACVRVCGCPRFFMTWSLCSARQEQCWSLRGSLYCSCFVWMWFLSWTRRRICEPLDISQPCRWRSRGAGVALHTLTFCSAACVCLFGMRLCGLVLWSQTVAAGTCPRTLLIFLLFYFFP